MTITLPPIRILIAIAVGVVLLAAGGWYFLSQNPLEKPSEVERTITAVGKLMYLPEGEEPTVATVTDLEALAGQPFFAQAELGHRVLIYTKAKKVILYDPEGKKIVEVAPLNIEASAP